MRTIFHIDMDAFFVSVEELLDPTLIGKAVIVGGKGTERGVVSAASYEARKFGVHSAMPLRVASRLCPHAIFLEGHMHLYAEYSGKVEEVLRSFSPAVSMASIDEAYLDMTGSERLWGPPFRAAHRLHEAIMDKVKLRSSIGVSTTRFVSKIASDQAKRNGILWIVPGSEAAWLAPLEVKRIPGVGKQTEKQLAEIGIKRIRDIAAAGETFLSKRFGQLGLALAGKAKGEDAGGWFNSEIGVEEAPKSISHEHTFSEDTTDAVLLDATLLRLVEKVMKRLREHKLYAKTTQLKLRFAGFETLTRAKTLSEPTDLDRDIVEAILEIFHTNWPKERRIRLLGVQVTHLSDTPPQPKLAFDDSQQRWKNALSAADKLKDKFGEGSLHLGGALKGVYRDRVHESAPKTPKK